MSDAGLPKRVEVLKRAQLLAVVGDIRSSGPIDLVRVFPAPRPEARWLEKPLRRGSFEMVVCPKEAPKADEVVAWERWRVRGEQLHLWFDRESLEDTWGLRCMKSRDLYFRLGRNHLCADRWVFERLGHELRRTPPQPTPHHCFWIVPNAAEWTARRLRDFVRDALGLTVTWADDAGRPVDPEHVTHTDEPRLYVWPVRNLHSPEFVEASVTPDDDGDAGVLRLRAYPKALEPALDAAIAQIPGLRARSGNCDLSLTEWHRFLRTHRYVPDADAREEDELGLAKVIRIGGR